MVTAKVVALANCQPSRPRGPPGGLRCRRGPRWGGGRPSDLARVVRGAKSGGDEGQDRACAGTLQTALTAAPQVAYIYFYSCRGGGLNHD